MGKPAAGQMAHTCLMVASLDRTIALYHDLLGMPLVKVVREGPSPAPYAALGSESDYLELFERPSGVRPPAPEAGAPISLGISHISVWVEDLEVLVPRLAEAGFPLIRSGKVRYARSWVGSAFDVAWIEDPDGVPVELLWYRGPAES
jgi:catechol 2,3-dioxygenase-like lactoylglutathione lyase family enzyme